MIKKIPFYSWGRSGLLNLLTVAFLGVVLRYKILFYLPFVEQKHLLHGHSHFAFTGWISQMIMIFMVRMASEMRHEDLFKKYSLLLRSNIVFSYLMLIAFSLEGYGTFSITFSTITILISYRFSYRIWQEINMTTEYNALHVKYLKAAMVFNFISSIGTFFLAYLMVNQISNQSLYLASVYFFLHFQYNGWFIFACLGLFIYFLQKKHIFIVHGNRTFTALTIALFPSYLLSTLWLKMPIPLYVLVVAAAFAQIISWGIILRSVVQQFRLNSPSIEPIIKWLLLFSAVALSIKFSLQLISTIPSLSQYAFGFRPVVIGYLHLVFLGIVTIFMLAYAIHEKLIPTDHKARHAIILFTAGIIINEIILMMQGLSYMNYLLLPFSNELLFITSILLLSGILLINVSVFKNKQY